MSEYIVELPNGGAADDYIRLRGYEKSLYGYELREEVVRCRDCKRCVRYETWNPEGEAFNCNYWGSDTEPDGFCAWGERRSE